MDFRVNLTIEVEQKANALAISKPVPVQLAYHRGQWHFECEDPSVTVPACRSLEEALVMGSQQVAAEVQAAAVERPFVVGKITPDRIPLGMF
ncbi:MAG TPA: hypothetical protein PLL20_00460 [Phycisphaerae bacterium]|nr:hypothetical protein [Phycisphaerae bacterium]HRR83532.1 hypothetical protein [Phycisphaerae bacterium]